MSVHLCGISCQARAAVASWTECHSGPGADALLRDSASGEVLLMASTGRKIWPQHPDLLPLWSYPACSRSHYVRWYLWTTEKVMT